MDGLVLAFAGVHRLGFGGRITQAIPFEIMLPAVGQGAVAVEVRDGDNEVLELIRPLDHEHTRVCVTAERAFLKTLEGGCQVPIGAHADLADGQVKLDGYVGSLDGRTSFRGELTRDSGDAEELGRQLAEDLIAQGAADLLAEARAQSESRAGAV